MARFRLTISSKSGPAMADLVRKYHLDVLDHGMRRNAETGHSVDAIVEEAQIEELRTAGYTVIAHEDYDQTGKDRQKEVGRGNRYKERKPR